ncbi:MAG: hypothetical protein IJ446_02785 [Oscillospiraceae bacterium]|nr:hypothetical protein [Oscillospiraceae bacterium]
MKQLYLLALAEETAETGTDVTTYIRLLCGIVGILLLIYVFAELTPKIAAVVDKLLGRENDPAAIPERVQAENYTVRDIYEGERSPDNNDNNKTEDK